MKNKQLLILHFLLLFAFKVSGQQEVISPRVVLNSDVCDIYGQKFSANSFTRSYFMCAHVYNVAFSEIDFANFIAKCESINSEIKVFKSSDNKALTCVFPKPSIKGITSFKEFVNSNFSPTYIPNLISSKTTHIEVVEQYDPLDKKRGFN